MSATSGEQTRSISIHALREEGDRLDQTIDQQAEIFLSTPSARRATFLVHSSVPNDAINISIHALREEGDAKVCRLCMRFGISIHALREEGDTRHSRHSTSNTNFYPRPPRGGRLQNIMMRAEQIWISIHALREEGDPVFANLGEQAILFLSTPSARRATFLSVILLYYIFNFYPRPPRGGRHIAFWSYVSH